MLCYKALKGLKKIYKLENAASYVCLLGIFIFFFIIPENVKE